MHRLDSCSLSGQRYRFVLAALLLVFLPIAGLGTAAVAQEPAEKPGEDELPTIRQKAEGRKHLPGLLPTYLDAKQAAVWVALQPPTDASGEVGRFLYVESLTQGLGSNPVNLDRGQLGDTILVRFRRVGKKLLIEQMNTRFVADSTDPLERRAVAESFATSVLWAGPVIAEDPGGKFLVDLTSFLVRDAHGSAAKLQATGQGAYSLDPERSTVDPAACLVFPDNLELEAVLTFAFQGGEGPGEHVTDTAPSARSVTLRQHHSLIRLPDDGFQPRAYHSASGLFPGAEVADYAAPLDEPLARRWGARFRLEKTDPSAASSPAVEPIVFYLDPGVPEPVRGALLDGAAWWADAFEAAGFEDAFRVEMLPPDAHPLDVRYNVIQWVHRSTRGWSYGGGVIDPRTGEILKGHVNLGSLRVRQDRLIFEGLLGTAKTGSGEPDDPVQLALARLRQLSAHEVGHAIGLAHNFAASTYGRASVMDYPAPRVRVGDDGELDASQAYAVGIGDWDRQAVRYGYSQFAEGGEAAGLAAILAENRSRGLVHIGDADSRVPGVGHPLASLWDNGEDPVDELAQTLAVRRHALDRFDLDNIPPGTPVALLHETLVPIYLYHRYQLEAAAKLVGGFEYEYSDRDDEGAADGSDISLAPVAADAQRHALATILSSLDPAELDLAEELLRLLLPRPLDYPDHRELFRGATAPGFDPLAAAGAAAELALQAVLQPQRAARLVDFQRRDPAQLSLEELLERVLAASFGSGEATAGDERREEIRRTVQRLTVERMIHLAAAAPSPAVRARTEQALRELATSLASEEEHADFVRRAQARALNGEIRRFLERSAPAAAPAQSAPQPPPGSPIGAGAPPFGGCSHGAR